ncbi:MAG: hypothetical protein Kow00124_10290 [Anaerolineae bacterium]
MHRSHPLWILIALLLITLMGCQPRYADPAPMPGAVGEGGGAAAGSEAPVPTDDTPPLLTAPPPGYYMQAGVPAGVRAVLAPLLAQAGWIETPAAEGAALRVMLDPAAEAAPLAEWVYTFVAPFPTVPDDISWEAFRRYWLTGDPGGMPDFGGAPTLLLTQDVANLIAARFGTPAAGLPLQIVEAEGLVEALWSTRPSLSVVPFDALTPRLKVLSLDGQSVLDRGLDTAAYPLTVRVGLEMANGRSPADLPALAGAGPWPMANRDPAHITVLTLTGVTAMARATAMQMELRGLDFPAQQILPFFADADILHTSNEVAFAVDCPPPDWVGEPIFCSNRKYYQLLETIGLDIVELTGNHVNDWGTQAFSYTLDVYDGNSLPYYGGGRTLDDARAPRILTAPDGTRIAFVGCNSAGPFSAYATTETPGAAPCEDWSHIRATIRDLKAAGQADLVVATVQYFELPSYTPSAEQVADFAGLAEAGADIVSGSQAHQPQGFSFVGESFIHYGVGNLFFDQMDYIENRQMFADKHILYRGRHISTVLFTGMMEHWAQPRPMTPQERAEFLSLIYSASGW